jgi:hypothetical protein
MAVQLLLELALSAEQRCSRSVRCKLVSSLFLFEGIETSLFFREFAIV